MTENTNVRVANTAQFADDYDEHIVGAADTAEDLLDYMASKAPENPDSNIYLQSPPMLTLGLKSLFFWFRVETVSDGLLMTYTGISDSYDTTPLSEI